MIFLSGSLSPSFSLLKVTRSSRGIDSTASAAARLPVKNAAHDFSRLGAALACGMFVFRGSVSGKGGEQ